MKPPARRLTPILGFAALLLALAAVFVAVLEKRFAAGDIYPYYSTARSDPLGASALYDSFAALPGYEVMRNQQNLMSLDTLDGESALWLCGLSRSAFARLRGPEDSPVLKAIRDQGARLIVTINPESVPEKYDLRQGDDLEDWLERREEAMKERRGATEDEDTGEVSPEDEEVEEEDPAALMGPLLSESLGAKLESPKSFERPEEGWTVIPGEGLAEAKRPVPDTLPLWRSQFRFVELDDAWTVAAEVDGQPVVIERSLGKGTIVLASDTHFASNEALWQGADPEFILWLGGGKTRLIFDETIHGSVESGGVMKMVRRYRFHGFFFGFLGFIALLAWKSASPLAPGSEALERGLISDSAVAVAGENTASGFIRLLRRNVPHRHLLPACLETWRQTSGRGLRGESAGQRAVIDRILSEHNASPRVLPAIEAYSRIAAVLAHPDAYRMNSENSAPADFPAPRD